MRPSSSAVLLALCSAIASASVVPIQLNRRAAGTRADPIPLEIDCTGGEQICNYDCYSILCWGSPNPTTYDAKNSVKKREQSGFRSGLLQVTAATREKKGIYISQGVLERVGFSPEETVMANALEGGWGEIIMPGDAKQNSLIGARVGGQLKKNVPDQKLYFRWFMNYGNLAPYCSALQGGLSGSFTRGVTLDRRLCGAKNKPDDDPSRISFTRTAYDGDDGQPHFHMMDFDSGDRWIGRAWGWQGSYPSQRRSVKVEEETKAEDLLE